MSSDKRGDKVNFFRDKLLNCQGEITEHEIKEIIRLSEIRFPREDGKKLWTIYSKYVADKWISKGENAAVVKNMCKTLWGAEDIDNKGLVADSGLNIKSKNEKDFAENYVVPFLKKDGHRDLFFNERTKDQFNPDIISTKGNVTYYSEVKYNLGGHGFQKGIGQLFFYQIQHGFDPDVSSENRFQLIFPEQYKSNRHFLHDTKDVLYKRVNIEILFVPG